jgi:hypothetical protein
VDETPRVLAAELFKRNREDPSVVRYEFGYPRDTVTPTTPAVFQEAVDENTWTRHCLPPKNEAIASAKMATRATKGKAAASSSNPAAQQETPQVPAVQDPERQLETSEHDDAPEPSNSVRSQVQELARSQAHTETVLMQILQRITALGNS